MWPIALWLSALRLNALRLEALRLNALWFNDRMRLRLMYAALHPTACPDSLVSIGKGIAVTATPQRP